MSTGESKPREWWIRPAEFTDEQDQIFWNVPGVEGFVQVIERTAYDAAVAELEQLKSYLPKVPIQPYEKELAQKYHELKADADALAEALEYQLVAIRKITEGSMFTPESERAAAEKVANSALTAYREKWGK